MAGSGMRFAIVALLFMFTAPALAQTMERAYGADPRQRLDFTPAQRRNAPLVLFVHGGAWSFGDKRAAAHMATHFQRNGYAFASINYRLVPEATVEQQAADVAAALASLVADAARIGIDGEQIILIGHSAGAHLAALVGTDPRYLAAHRIPVTAIDGVVLLDGAGYDVPRQIDAAGPLLRRMYLRAFGHDAARQRALSPIAHAAAPNAHDFYIIHSAHRADSAAQSAALAEALNSGDSVANVQAVDDSHAGIFRRFGEPGHDATDYAGAFMALALATADLREE